MIRSILVQNVEEEKGKFPQRDIGSLYNITRRVSQYHNLAREIAGIIIRNVYLHQNFTLIFRQEVYWNLNFRSEVD